MKNISIIKIIKKLLFIMILKNLSIIKINVKIEKDNINRKDFNENFEFNSA